LLIDSSHKKWMISTSGLALVATALYVWARQQSAGVMTGASPAGLWFGVAGSLLMIFAGLLSALRKVPSWWWLGPRKTWLRGHVWLGLLSVLLIFFHSGFRLGGVLEQALWALLLLITVSGIFGVMVQQFLPRLLTVRIPCEAPVEQIPHLCRRLREEADKLVDTVAGDPASAPRQQLGRFHEEVVRPFLADDFVPSAPLAAPLQAEAIFGQVRALPGMKEVEATLNELETLCTERRYLGEQERLHHWLHGWLIVHVPMSAALLVLGVAHAILSLYF
jgi:hypothetical protein